MPEAFMKCVIVGLNHFSIIEYQFWILQIVWQKIKDVYYFAVGKLAVWDLVAW